MDPGVTGVCLLPLRLWMPYLVAACSHPVFYSAATARF